MPGVLCEHCTAVCCRYIALPMDTPRTQADFDDLRWFLIHEHVSVFVEDNAWYISFQTTCRHLQADHRCGIYATRPNICRQYDTDHCDYHSGDYGWQHHFTVPQHLDAYLREHPVAAGRGPRAGTGPRRAGQRSKLKVGRPRRPRTLAPPDHDRRGIPLPIMPWDRP